MAYIFAALETRSRREFATFTREAITVSSPSRGIDAILTDSLVVGDRIRRHVFFGFSRSNSVSGAPHYETFFKVLWWSIPEIRRCIRY